MRSLVRRSTALVPLVLFIVAGCAKARPGGAPPASAEPVATVTTTGAAAAPGAGGTDAAGVPRPASDGRAVTVSRAEQDEAMTAQGPASLAVRQFRAEAAAAFGDPSVNALWGVEIQSLDTGEVLYAQNAHALMTPASNMKILTMSIAATQLGWDYRFATPVSAAGTIANGTLTGDLVITGSSDPTISDRGGAATRVFESWADQLRTAGITHITGRIVGDDDRFDDRPIGEGWSWDDFVGQYAVPGGALQYNENIVRVIVTPAAAAGQAATVRLEPEGADIVVHNAVTTGPEASGADVNLSRERNEHTLFVTGSVPAGGKEIRQNAAVDNPTAFFVNALRATLIRKGIAVDGPAVDIDDLTRGSGSVGSGSVSRGSVSSGSANASGASGRGAARAGNGGGSGQPVSETRRVLFTHQSPPLSEIGTTFMKVSQNLFGETLMAVLGERALTFQATDVAAIATPPAAAAASSRAMTGTTATTPAATDALPVSHHHVEAARTLYERTLAGWGIPRSEFVLSDGSGMSRYNLVTPHMLTRILRRMSRDAALGPTFETTLPIGGKDGTLGPRMKGTKSENNVHAKTGSLSGVRALSGYMRTADGERVVFSILANNYNAPTAAIDGITDLVLERLANFTRK